MSFTPFFSSVFSSPTTTETNRYNNTRPKRKRFICDSSVSIQLLFFSVICTVICPVSHHGSLSLSLSLSLLFSLSHQSAESVATLKRKRRRQKRQQPSKRPRGLEPVEAWQPRHWEPTQAESLWDEVMTDWEPHFGDAEDVNMELEELEGLEDMDWEFTQSDYSDPMDWDPIHSVMDEDDFQSMDWESYPDSESDSDRDWQRMDWEPSPDETIPWWRREWSL